MFCKRTQVYIGIYFYMGVIVMSRSKSQKEAQKRYVKKHYRLEVLLPANAPKILQEHANLMGMSITEFTNQALKRAIKLDRKMLKEQQSNNSDPQMRMHKPTKKSNT